MDNLGIKKLLGFGCMRLPMNGDEVDTEQFSKMVDYYLENGFNYFDTAHGYIDGKSEKAIKTSLTSRHSRDEYLLANKLSGWHFNSEEEILPLFESQLAICGVDYFDVYLMHAQNGTTYEKFKSCHAYETAISLRDAGKIKYFGISFHDKADVLEKILTEYPQIDVVQIQFNYLDFEDASIQSKRCYEVCRKHNKPVLIMEPVKGGKLADIPEEGKAVFSALGDGMSPASYAIRFAAGFEGVISVLSGMGSMEMMVDNVSYMKNFKPLSESELEAIQKVRDIIIGEKLINCTDCRYCVSQCVKKIPIPAIFACMNNAKVFKDWGPKFYYSRHTADCGKASDCISCGKCEAACPQFLPIRTLLKEATAQFEE